MGESEHDEEEARHWILFEWGFEIVRAWQGSLRALEMSYS